MKQSQAQPANGFPLAVVVEGALALGAIALAWLFGVELRQQFPATRSSWVEGGLRGIASTIPMLVFFWWLVRSPYDGPRRLRNQVERIVDELFPDASLPQFALIAILAGVGEELLFRGVLQPLFQRWTTPVVGLLLASLIFGAAHALSQTYFLLATLIGVYFGWLLFHFHDLFAPIIAHSLYDFVALVYIAKNRTPANSSTP